MWRKRIPYNGKLKDYARELRNNSTLSEVLLWKHIRKNALGVQFNRQYIIDNYIVDFYAPELNLAIEIDGDSHDDKFDYDIVRQTKLEQKGIIFIRFSDLTVKQNITDVLYAILSKIQELKKKTSP